MASKQKSDINPGQTGTERAPRTTRSETAKKAAQARPESLRAEGDGLARLSEDELNAMISRAAYLRAEKRGFEPGHEVEDWLAAEAEIRATMSRGSQQKR